MPSSRIAPGTLGTRVSSGMRDSPVSTARPVLAAPTAQSPALSHPGTRNLTHTHSARRVTQGRAKAQYRRLSRAHPVASALSGGLISVFPAGPLRRLRAGNRKYQLGEKAAPAAPPPLPPPITGVSALGQRDAAVPWSRRLPPGAADLPTLSPSLVWPLRPGPRVNDVKFSSVLQLG